ncbi:hypothetical protein PMIN04_011177 [Paraphaeosphaeria minitans]
MHLPAWPASTGKSPIARTVPHRYFDKRYLVATIFFSRAGGDVSHAGKFVTNIAVQLAHNVAAWRINTMIEYGENDNVEIIVRLLAVARSLERFQLQVIVTSRRVVPIRKGFGQITHANSRPAYDTAREK